MGNKKLANDDLAFEAIRLIREKNLKFTLDVGGSKWSASFTPREEYEKNKAPATSTSTATDAVAAPQNPGATKAKKPAAAH